MKLTKFVHSCVLIELDSQTILCDPGDFSWESGTLDITDIPRLDTVVITHDHPDHFHPEFVRAIMAQFPDVQFVGPKVVVEKLKMLNVKHASTEAPDPIQVFSRKKHASNVPLDPVIADNIAVHIADKITIGGDRHDIEETKDVFAFPITAPWGSARDAMEMLLRLKPKVAIPIHDWHWNEEARQREYDRFERILRENGIQFLQPTDGEALDLS